jgi:glycerol-3-phosphate acyltransferase PlsX
MLTPTVRLAVDVHGGDRGPDTVIRGVLEGVREYPDPLTVHLCGDRVVIEEVLREAGVGERVANATLVIQHSPGTIGPKDIPSKVWKSKKDASIIRCITLQKEGLVDASLSAGDTRILVGAAIFILGRREGVDRPALAAFLPTTSERSCLLLDVGANLDCRAAHLIAFALTGCEFYRSFYALEHPSVALLNVGVEPGKGTRAIIEAGRELATSWNCYSGFVEGSGVLAGDADVVVCDGFAGNVLLKACESFHSLTEAVLGPEPAVWSKLKSRMGILNPENYGAAPLVGIHGTVLKAHGASSPQAIAYALLAAVRAARRYTRASALR